MHWHSLHGAWRCVGQGIHGGINFPWAHTVDADVLKSIFQCSTFRKTHYAMLECDVGSAPSAPADAHHRCRVDDNAATLAKHLRYLVLHAQPITLQIHIGYFVVRFCVKINELNLRGRNTGIVESVI